eukprot:CAMPEP_0114580948 /NCGR_PEP_ID=MMETSP0125-20121206/5115_1 /TAXON_ID=485358 ORGANISM="Aristerostoma sp., Strain ATCC 50986" /NCGR_SAMPLE_ID=MMETSP0125 /ASSEMBLY_ACC=CAM_ASM_000245 /LENGTH=398 /DNA_ID=CAMNT_0001772783 /DNA_START=60 /DNA_END=1253 /DNA_ORIENTATION=-
MDQQANNQFLQDRVNPILEKMLVDIIAVKPDNVIEFMKSWLEKNGDSCLSPQKKQQQNEDWPESEEDDDDEVDELPEKLKKAKERGTTFVRNSVSAEAFGVYNPVKEFVPKVIEKSNEQRKKIRDRLSQVFMFSALDEKSFNTVIDSMDVEQRKADETIIKQGDNGDHLYVVDSGNLDCFKRFSKDEEPKLVKQYEPGDFFGELALLYNAPRAATIQAKSDCTLFLLDRETFNYIVKDAAVKKRERYEEFLKGLEVLSTLDTYEISQLADSIKPCSFNNGDTIIQQGEQGDVLYFIEEGSAEAFKTLAPNQPPQKVYSYKPGDYFGELALLKNVNRQATVKATSDIKLASLDRRTLKRLVGSLGDLLKRDYPKFERFSMHIPDEAATCDESQVMNEKS